MDLKRVLFLGDILITAQANPLARTGVFVVVDRLLRKFLEKKEFNFSVVLPDGVPSQLIATLKSRYGLAEGEVCHPKENRVARWKGNLFKTFLHFRKKGARFRELFFLVLTKLSRLVPDNPDLLLDLTPFSETEFFIVNPSYKPIKPVIKRRGQNIQLVHIIYDLIPIVFPEYFNNQTAKEHLLYHFLKKTRRRHDIYASISKQTHSDLTRFLKASVRGGVFYLGYERPELSTLRPNGLSRVLDTNQKILLSVSTIEPRKNLDFSLKLFRMVEERHPSEYRFVVVGAKGWEKDKTLELVYSMASVYLVGYVEDEALPEYFRAAHAFLYPSFYEGFGLPVIEAMSYGLPVLVSNNSSLPEVAGDAGLYIDPLRPESGLGHLENLNSMEYWKSVSDKSLKQAAKFSWESAYRDLAALILEEDRQKKGR